MSILKKTLYIVLALGVIFCTFQSGYIRGIQHQTSLPVPPPVILDSNKLLELSNQWRISNNLKPYIKLERLCDSTKIRVVEIQTNWSHEGFEASRFCGKTEWCDLAENLGRFATSEEDIFKQWINSSGHLANLKKDYKYSCVATSTNYAVQHFGNFPY